MHCRQILAHMNPCGPSVQKEVQPRMAKISANYEVVFIMDGRLPEEQVAALTEKFKTLVEQNSTAMEVEEWGKRKLAYAINYITEGYYVLISFTSAPDFPKELDRILGITDGIIRSMIVCKGGRPRLQEPRERREGHRFHRRSRLAPDR